jgi:hypothetical protein
MSNSTTLDAHNWLKRHLNGEWSKIKSGEYIISLDDVITLFRGVQFRGLDFKTFPFKFKNVKDFRLYDCKIINFNNFPNFIDGSLVINNCDFHSLDGLENIIITGDIFIWHNTNLTSYNAEINSALIQNDIRYSNEGDIHYIDTGRNKIYSNYDKLLGIQRELKLKQFTD